MAKDVQKLDPANYFPVRPELRSDTVYKLLTMEGTLW